MSQSLTEIAQALKDSTKNVQLIYGFNGTGKQGYHVNLDYQLPQKIPKTQKMNQVSK